MSGSVDAATDGAVWTGPITLSLTWREDLFGQSDHSLYMGNLFVGYIQKVASDADPNEIRWTGVLMTDDYDGSRTRAYKDPQRARDVLVDAALKALRA